MKGPGRWRQLVHLRRAAPSPRALLARTADREFPNVPSPASLATVRPAHRGLHRGLEEGGRTREERRDRTGKRTVASTFSYSNPRPLYPCSPQIPKPAPLGSVLLDSSRQNDPHIYLQARGSENSHSGFSRTPGEAVSTKPGGAEIISFYFVDFILLSPNYCRRENYVSPKDISFKNGGRRRVNFRGNVNVSDLCLQKSDVTCFFLVLQTEACIWNS